MYVRRTTIKSCPTVPVSIAGKTIMALLGETEKATIVLYLFFRALGLAGKPLKLG